MAEKKPEKAIQPQVLINALGEPAPTPAQQQELQAGVNQTLGRVVPVLQIEMQPTNVDPRTPAGIQNMKRVLNSLLNDENARITAKNDQGKPVGVCNFRDIYPSLHGPNAAGAIQIEYHEQATLGWVGDTLWSVGWFFQHGVLGVPRQLTRALLQAAGISFLLESYYQKWLVSLLDQLHQQGVLPGYLHPETQVEQWEIFTETAGRNIVVRPRAVAVKE